MILGRNLLKSDVPIPDWWCSTAEQINQELSEKVTRGKVETLAFSPAKRPVRAVFYGEAEPEWKGLANFNSAIGAGESDAYYRRDQRQRPVLLLLAGIHGHEVEGMMGALSVIRIMETGRDLMGRAQPELASRLRQLRLIIVPLANPDGRERVPYKGWIGLPQDEMTFWGQGSRKNGESYRWRPCKAVHPMVGDVGLLGAYFDENGVNMMHDDWANPMSETTKSLLKLVAAEGPDCLINLHSYSSPCGVLQTAYVPWSHQRRVYDFSRKLYDKLDKLGIIHSSLPNEPLYAREAPDGLQQSFNLQSMFYHIGSAFNLLFESTHGVSPLTAADDYSVILDSHHHLFQLAAEELLP